METIAFFGTGLLGSGFVRAFRRRGIGVHVWNRTPAKARALEEYGAIAYERPDDAARDVSRVHLCLRDDPSVDATLEAALPGIARGTLVIDHTTVAPEGVAERAARLAARGLLFVHAPVFMGPPNALDGTGVMMCSAAQPLYEEVKALLEPMTGQLVYLGDRIDKAALFKLMGNATLLAVIGGVADVFRIAEANGITRADAFGLFSFFNPSGQIAGRGRRMAQGEYEPTWTLDVAHKDALLMLAAANGRTLPVIDAMEAELRQAKAQGLGDRDLGAVAETEMRHRSFT
jgi:3-hydroxyisobutyrate dehydrogenase